MSGPVVDPANTDAQRSWDGADGEYWAEHHDVFDASMAGYVAPLLDAAALTASDRVLDIGCGNGVTTLAAAHRIPQGRVLGADLSGAMLAVARNRAGHDGLGNAEFVQADAQIHPFEPASFDAVISRFGVMFFGDPAAAFTNIGRAVRPGGRLAMLVWQSIERNEWVRAVGAALGAGRALPAPPPGAPGPLSLADPGRVCALLTIAGFDDVTLTAVAEPMSFGPDSAAALEFVLGLPFARFMLRDLDGAARVGALDALRATIEGHLTPDGVQFAAAAWLVTAIRH